MNKIDQGHLERDAFVYIRQSTPDQLTNNPESRRRQYALETRAKTLGWENVVVIDEDLGRSGGGTARPGFERLLTAICTGTAGSWVFREAKYNLVWRAVMCRPGKHRSFSLIGEGSDAALTAPTTRPREATTRGYCRPSWTQSYVLLRPRK